MSLTKKERDKTRQKIVEFCQKWRTYKEVKEKFNISGISVAAYLSGLRCSGICEYDRNKNAYRTIKKYRTTKK